MHETSQIAVSSFVFRDKTFEQHKKLARGCKEIWEILSDRWEQFEPGRVREREKIAFCAEFLNINYVSVYFDSSLRKVVFITSAWLWSFAKQILIEELVKLNSLIFVKW